MPSNPFEEMLNQINGNYAQMTSQYNALIVETKIMFVLSLLTLPLVFFIIITFIEYKKRLRTLERETVKKMRAKIPDYNKITPVQRKAQEDLWISEIDVNEVYGKLIMASVPRGLKWASTILVSEVIIRLLAF
jgi:hypothetical protein